MSTSQAGSRSASPTPRRDPTVAGCSPTVAWASRPRVAAQTAPAKNSCSWVLRSSGAILLFSSSSPRALAGTVSDTPRTRRFVPRGPRTVPRTRRSVASSRRFVPRTRRFVPRRRRFVARRSRFVARRRRSARRRSRHFEKSRLDFENPGRHFANSRRNFRRMARNYPRSTRHHERAASRRRFYGPVRECTRLSACVRVLAPVRGRRAEGTAVSLAKVPIDRREQR